MADLALLTIHTDGGSRGNPGPAAFAYTIDGAEESPIEEAGRLGPTTNNVAEYTALVRALEHALELGANYRVKVVSDSELMVKQMKGEYRVKNADLLDLYGEACDIARRFEGGVAFQHVRRELNKRADALCNEALDGLREPTPRASTFAPRPPPGKPAPTPPRPTPAPVAAARGPVVEATLSDGRVSARKALTLRDEALACLRQAAEAWAEGEEAPTPEAVWEQLVETIRRHCVL